MAITLEQLVAEMQVRKAVTPLWETGDTNKGLPWAQRDGSLVTVDWAQALANMGRVFFGYVGIDTTPATLDAAWANTDPDVSLDVPQGTTAIPLRITVIYEAFGTDLLAETITLVSRTPTAYSAGTLLASIPTRTDGPVSSACKFVQAPTVTSGYTAGAFELFRDVYQLVGTMAAGEAGPNPKREWAVGLDGVAPVLVGPASMATWAVSQAATGYIQYQWAEVPSNLFT